MRRVLLGTLSLLILLSTATVGAAPNPTRGLQITPVQQEHKLDAGSLREGSLVVANLTTKPLDVSLAVQQFSVNGLAYNYSFSRPEKPWISLSTTALTLTPGQSQTIRYTLHPDTKATPGGYYYSIIASTTDSTTGLASTLRAASLLYITINGQLTQTGQIRKISAPRIVLTRQFNVSVDALNTGNVYYFARVSGHLKGLFTGTTEAPASHLLIPDKTRRVSSVVSSPLFPGIYPLEVSYKTDAGTTVHDSQLVVCLPPWSIAALLAIALLAGRLFRKKQTKT